MFDNPMMSQALASAAFLLLVLFRFRIRRVAGYATIVDIGTTAMLMWMFSGTFAGMMTGVFAGVVISLTLNVIRALFGYERLTLTRYKGRIAPSLRWKRQGGFRI